MLDVGLAADGPHLLGEAFSAADIYLQMMTTWRQPVEALWPSFPAIRRLPESSSSDRPANAPQSDATFGRVKKKAELTLGQVQQGGSDAGQQQASLVCIN